jgi:hypothetical protein
VGTRASREGEPYAQEANVTDAAMVRLMSNLRHPITTIHTQTMAKGCGNEVGADIPVGAHPATGRSIPGEREPHGPYIP